MKKTLVVILGPTGIGKTALSINLAKYFTTEIISADSRQIFKEITIGTAKPSLTELESITHHLINYKSIHEYYNAYNYEVDALETINQLFTSKNVVIMVGGSMMYIDAVCNGIDDLPTIDLELRKTLISKYEKEGIESIRNDLARIDPDYYKLADLKNYKRILKALEVYYMTGKPYSSLRTQSIKERSFNIIKTGLNRPREELYNIINQRVDIMLDEGLIEEARTFYKYKELNALNTVGYKELFDYFDGAISKDKAIELIKRNSRRYAKRQLTWFTKDNSIKWFHPDEKNQIIDYINRQL